LHIPEDKFWRMTPRKFFALSECHVKANSTSENINEQQPEPERLTLEELMAMKGR
jgi:hypothetical protein